MTKEIFADQAALFTSIVAFFIDVFCTVTSFIFPLCKNNFGGFAILYFALSGY